MKKSIIYLLSSTIIIPALVSCSDFLDQNPDLRTTLDSEEKIASILVSAYVSGSGSYQILAELSSDNVCDHGITKNYNQFYQDVYEWAEDVTSNNDAPKNIWSANYNNIANANQALAAIEDMGGPTTTSLKASKGEALLCRAYSHFVLANLFCMPYNSETAENYLGIPYMDHAETDLNPQYERGTLKEVYEKMGRDIEEGIPLIDDTSYSVTKYHFNYKAACCFASRYYLFIHDWENAIKYATMALTNTPESLLRDYDAIAALPSGSSRHQAYVNSSSTANFLLQAATSSSGTVFGCYSTDGRYSHGKL
ncbi:MAG: RagB/SusD family nutrient uptake outer membrane protein, partial [Alistipes sp.]|nr:RagB/SusD family nutrient uptake outer membrane protein [Alistipes sp.]